MKKILALIVLPLISLLLIWIVASFPNKAMAQAPVADFTCSADTFYYPLCCGIKFTDLSANSPTNWLWDFCDGVLSTEQNPTHCFVSPGSYCVMLLATNASGTDTVVKLAYIVTDSTTCSCDSLGTGVKDMTSEIGVNISTQPNPNSGSFILSIESKEKTTTEINLFALSGQVVYSKKILDLFGKHEEEIDIRLFSKGIYFLKVSTDRGALTEKLVFH